MPNKSFLIIENLFLAKARKKIKVILIPPNGQASKKKPVKRQDGLVQRSSPGRSRCSMQREHERGTVCI